MSHALRAEMLMLLTERAASPAEMAKELDAPLDSVSHHTRRLVELGCAEMVRKDEVPGTGAIRHVYKATVRHEISAEEWAGTDEAVGLAIASDVVQAMVDDFNDSARAHMFRPDGDLYLARTLHVLDEEGYARVVKIQDEAREAILEEQTRSADRLVGSAEEARHVTTWHAAFEVPPSSGR